MKIIKRTRTPYNEVDVWETDTGFDFEVAGGTHATWDRERILTDYAWEKLKVTSL